MDRNPFPTGTQFRLDGKHYSVENPIGKTQVIVREKRTGICSPRSTVELKKAFTQGRLTFEDLLTAVNISPDDEEVIQRLSDFPTAQKDEAVLRLKLLRAICPNGQMLVSRNVLANEVGRHWRALDTRIRPRKPPSVATVYDWRGRWLRSGFNPCALIPNFEIRGRTPRPIADAHAPIVAKYLDESYLQLNRPSVQHVLELINGQIDRTNKGLPVPERISLLTRACLVREIGRLDRFTLLKARYGPRFARRKTQIFTQAPHELVPLRRVEMDHTPLDILLLSDDRKTVLGRAYATALLDCATRMPLALWISFREPNTESVLRAVKQAILPKDLLLKDAGLDQLEWPVWGLFELLVLDNGSEFHSEAFEKSMEDLGISLLYCPKKEPYLKGKIERWLKELNYSFVHLLPGTTFAKYWLREEYKSEDYATFTISDMRSLGLEWLAGVFANKFQTSLLACPRQKWDELITEGMQILPRDARLVDIALSGFQQRTLSNKGIELETLHYVSQELRELFHTGHKGQLTVRPNPDNVGEIHVLDPRNKTYFRATATNHDMHGLTVEQFAYIRKCARAEYANTPYPEALRASKLRLFEASQEIAATANEVKRDDKAKRKAAKKSPKTVNNPKTRKKRPVSGREKQAMADSMEQQARRNSETPSPKNTGEADADLSSKISFSDLKAFPTGQSNLGEL
jgi:putative transposase